MANNKVQLADGTTLIDLTDTTAAASDVAAGKYFYTAAGVKTAGTGSGGGGGGGTKTGTVSGTGTRSVEIPCPFAPDLIIIDGDLSQTPSLRGVVTTTIIKDTEIYVVRDSSSSGSGVSIEIIAPINGYNESDTSHMHASYANNVLTIDTGSNSSSNVFTSDITYSYELIAYGNLINYS